MKKYTIEMWCERDQCWKLLIGTPQRFDSRAAAEKQLRFEAGEGQHVRRCRLVNGRGVTVLHAGRVQS